MRRLQLWLSLGFSALLIGFWGFSEPDLREAFSPMPVSQEVDAYLVDAHITEFDEAGKPARQVTAQRVSHHPQDDSTHLVLPQVQLMREARPPVLTSARTGVITSGGAQVILEEAVEIRSDSPDNPYRLNTEHLILDPNLKIAETTHPVQLHSTLGTTHATGMKAYIDEGRLELLSKVRGTYEPQ